MFKTSKIYKSFLNFLFPDSSADFLKKRQATLDKINKLESVYKNYSKEDFQEKIQKLKNIYQEKKDEKVLIEVFAIVREVSNRVLFMRHFDVQILAGIALSENFICEVKTGEGKTLIIVCPAVLSVVKGNKVHIATANDYLAERDCTIMSKIYNYLGITCAFINEEMSREEIQKAYKSDILYSHSRDLMINYLRDQLVPRKELKLFFNGETIEKPTITCIIDECDHCMLSEASIPTIITTPTRKTTNLYKHFAEILDEMQENIHYTINYKNNTSSFTETGFVFAEEKIKERGLCIGNLYSKENSYLYKYLKNALVAKCNIRENIEYVVKNKKVILVDSNTGRLARDRFFSDGLSGSVSAKHKLVITNAESETVAYGSYFVYFGHNYFNLNQQDDFYDFMCGLSGTAINSSEEFLKIYNSKVVSIPTNKPSQRKDYPMKVYRYKEDCYSDMIKKILEINSTGCPVLIGTFSVEDSEKISALLKEKEIKHNILNAKHHEEESKIIANAGKEGTITIATNMAGRGTDIKLGGNYLDEFELNKSKHSDEDLYRKNLMEKYAERERDLEIRGGLHVIIASTPPSEDLEYQLKGRSGRQGQNGRTFMFLSFEDEVLCHLPKEPINAAILDNLYKDNRKYLENNNYVKDIIKKVQDNKGASESNMRLHLYKITSIIHYNHQKKIYSFRDTLLISNNLKKISQLIFDDFRKNLKIDKNTNEEKMIFLRTELRFNNIRDLESEFKDKLSNSSEETIRSILLESLDNSTRNFLEEVEQGKKKIYLSNFSQTNPINDFKKNVEDIFKDFLDDFRSGVIRGVIEGHISNDFFDKIPCQCGSKKLIVDCCGKSLSKLMKQ